MPNALMYENEMFVVLEADQPEQFLSSLELSQKLSQILATYDGSLPKALEKMETLTEKADHLRDNYCDLDLGADRYLQWYTVRLEK